MTWRRFAIAAGTALLSLAAGCNKTQARGGNGNEVVTATAATDAIAVAILAHRATYAQTVVERLAPAGVVQAAPAYDGDRKRRPLPVQFLRLSGEHVAKSPQADRLRFRLLSDWAINKANVAQTDFERAGLAALQKDPETPFRNVHVDNGKRYFDS